ncbi:hypothetical protein PG993_011629 [Apiospora rasikravindrae]|uniref:Uncharacterized protein n=1 Tax=Apiospora rasikravindrae TaxID=990691 RepID=A0ABR1S0B8_9PEZI
MQNATDPNTEPVQRPSTPDGLREFTGTPPDQESLHHYGDAINRISNLLLEDLLRWDAEGLQVHPFAIRPAMFGKSEADARLWMVVCCDERLHRHTKRFFNKQQVRELFEPPERPDVAFKVYIATSVIPLARPVAQMPASVIHGFAHNNELCGAPLWLFNPDTSAARQVTLGGVLKVATDGRERCFGITVGHAVDEPEDRTTPTKMGAEWETDNLPAGELDSSDAESSESGTSSSLGEEDLQIGSQIEPPRNQERENPWASSSVMLTMDKATANPDTGTYYDWALVDLGNLPNHLEVYNEGARRVDGQRLLPLVPSSQDIDNAQGSPVVVMSSEGPKSGRISFFLSKLLLSPGRAFVDTYIVHLYKPYGKGNTMTAQV